MTRYTHITQSKRSILLMLTGTNEEIYYDPDFRRMLIGIKTDSQRLINAAAQLESDGFPIATIYLGAGRGYAIRPTENCDPLQGGTMKYREQIKRLQQDNSQLRQDKAELIALMKRAIKEEDEMTLESILGEMEAAIAKATPITWEQP